MKEIKNFLKALIQQKQHMHENLVSLSVPSPINLDYFLNTTSPKILVQTQR